MARKGRRKLPPPCTRFDRTTLNLPKGTMGRIEVVSEEVGVTISDLMRRWIMKGLEDMEGPIIERREWAEL